MVIHGGFSSASYFALSKFIFVCFNHIYVVSHELWICFSGQSVMYVFNFLFILFFKGFWQNMSEALRRVLSVIPLIQLSWHFEQLQFGPWWMNHAGFDDFPTVCTPPSSPPVCQRCCTDAKCGKHAKHQCFSRCTQVGTQWLTMLSSVLGDYRSSFRTVSMSVDRSFSHKHVAHLLQNNK